MDKWIQRFLDMAHLVGSWSKDDSTHVGAVLVDPDKRVISVGFNGPPRRAKDGAMTRGTKLRRTIHAEMNCLHFSNKSVEGATIFITHPPCAQCAAHLVQRGIAHVVHPEPEEGFKERWKEDIAEASALFEEAGVTVTQIAGVKKQIKVQQINQTTPFIYEV